MASRHFLPPRFVVLGEQTLCLLFHFEALAGSTVFWIKMALVVVQPERGRGGAVLHLDGAEAGPGALRVRGVLVAASGWDPSGWIRALRVDVPLERP